MKNPLIPHEDYCRIFRTIYSLLVNIKAEMLHSCISFGVLGAAILDQHYRLNPKVFMGIAAYMIDDKSQSLLTFAEKDGDRLVSSEAGFHSWIVANDFVIDFTSPLFPSMIKEKGGKTMYESKMFQKEIEKMAHSPRQLTATGDFFMRANAKLTNELMDRFAAIPSNIDLMDICCCWYRRPPSEMHQVVGIPDGRGTINNIQLQSFHVSGAW